MTPFHGSLSVTHTVSTLFRAHLPSLHYPTMLSDHLFTSIDYGYQRNLKWNLFLGMNLHLNMSNIPLCVHCASQKLIDPYYLLSACAER